MTHTAPTPDARYAALVQTFARRPGVTLGVPGKKGFGADALQVGGKIFAMLSKGRLVVKLPRQRVDALVAAGAGERFDLGHGRVMKEWFALAPESAEDWASLANEAMRFVSGGR